LPVLPLDHPDPLAATLGIMLYPGVDEADRKSAASWTLKFLTPVIAGHRGQGGSIRHDDLIDLVIAGGSELSDVSERNLSGRMTGEIFKTYFALAQTHPDRASWSNAQRIVTHVAGRAGHRAGTTHLKAQRNRHRSVAHLWAAASIREYRFGDDASVGYDGLADFMSFLAEAELLRHWGETWKQPLAKAMPPLSGMDIWRSPDDWSPLPRLAGWPSTGRIPVLTLPDELVDLVRPAGRPKKAR
jgi:hypothetical protein